ncbi:hypothetical protein [Breoghania sp.]|uniref:hypothetical protein n=1 Tax=Breoghania sp. TaxID=2065378 RepID=UPI00263665A0|nr:hypothetical protein [Breoghania sp.]MDJ0933369.1 hypothetical protein [Breoghania sp.]
MSADAVVGTGALEGCRLPDEFSVSESDLADDETTIVRDILSGERRGKATATYLILVKRSQPFDNDVATILAAARDRLLPAPNPVIDASFALLVGDVLFDGKAFFDQALWEKPLVVEAFALGHIDPVVILIWRCMFLRSARGVVEPSGSIAARNVAYDELDALLKTRTWTALVQGAPVQLRPAKVAVVPDEPKVEDSNSPRFFAAAHNVTRLLGVGLVDAVDLYDGVEGYANALDDLPFDPECTGWGDKVPDFLPRAKEREFLRHVNFQLYRNINISVVQELLRTDQLFDPVDWGLLDTQTKERADMEFDQEWCSSNRGGSRNSLPPRGARPDTASTKVPTPA